jgi:hypothetical protein
VIDEVFAQTQHPQNYTTECLLVFGKTNAKGASRIGFVSLDVRPPRIQKAYKLEAFTHSSSVLLPTHVSTYVLFELN